MKSGLVCDSLSHLPLSELLQVAKLMDIEGVEINTGNWSSAPHVDLAGLLASKGERRAFLGAFEERGLALIALNANGNPLHPTDGERQSTVIHDTLTLAGALCLPKLSLIPAPPPR